MFVFGEGPAASEAAKPLGLTDWVDEALLRLEHWRHRRVVVTAFAGLALVALAVGWAYGRTKAGPPVESGIPQAISAAAPVSTEAVPANPPSDAGDDSATTTVTVPAQAEGNEQYIVHVVGEVNRPGLVTVSADARVNAAVTAAGGPTVDADLQRLNLAAPLSDGMQIRVPAIGAEDAGPLLSHPGTGTSGTDGDQSGPVNVNTAPADVLETLPGVGPATAAAIVVWREDNGGFLAVDDLMDVPGIGPAKLAAVRDLITV